MKSINKNILKQSKKPIKKTYSQTKSLHPWYWPTIPENEACLAVRLLYPVTHHLRRDFPFSKRYQQQIGTSASDGTWFLPPFLSASIFFFWFEPLQILNMLSLNLWVHVGITGYVWKKLFPLRQLPPLALTVFPPPDPEFIEDSSVSLMDLFPWDLDFFTYSFEYHFFALNI